MQHKELIAKATDWVLAQAKSQKVDLKTNGYAWTIIVDEAVDQFDVDIEQLEKSLRSELVLAATPESPLRPKGFTAVGLTVITDPIEVAHYQALAAKAV